MILWSWYLIRALTPRQLSATAVTVLFPVVPPLVLCALPVSKTEHWFIGNDGVVLGVSEQYDNACVWVQPELPLAAFKGRVLKIGDSDDLRIGDTVYVIGFSDDDLPADTIVEDISNRYITLRGNFRTADTGGHPVIDQYGEAVGMIRGRRADGTKDQAILINRIREEMPAMCGSALP